MINARAASIILDQIPPGSVVGLGGNGISADLASLLPTIRQRLRGVLVDSADTAMQLKARGLEMLALNDVDAIDVYFGGALEATPSGCLNTGSNPGLARGRVMADLARRFAAIVDHANLVEQLGEHPFALEVLPVARRLVEQRLTALGASPLWEEGGMTEDGNLILNAGVPPDMEEWMLEAELDQIPGVVAHSIFSRRPADLLIITTDRSAETLELRDLKRNLV